MPGKTEVITDEGKIVSAIEHFQTGIKKTWCACVESSIPAFSVGRVKQGYADAKMRGVKIMYITEITADNASYCKEIMNYAELRHLDNVKGSFALSETEYVAGFMEKGVMVRLVRTDVPEIVSQQHLLFQTLWHHAIPGAEWIAKTS